jgi:hypothetical protein
MITATGNPELDGARSGAFLANAILIRARSMGEGERADFIERAAARISGAVDIGCQIMSANGGGARDVSRYRDAAVAAAKLRFSLDQVRGWGIT